MVKAVEAAKRAARRAQEATYDGRCTVIEYQQVKDETTKLTGKKEVAVIEDQPCRLAYEKSSAASQTETAAGITQGIKLFLAPETVIKGGSKIIVMQNGITGVYCASGKPAVYSTHQEVVLELFEGWV